VSAVATSRVGDAFLKARRARRPVIIPYFVAGFPSPAETAGLVVAAAEAGADLIEIGLPFSDPLADGPVIQAASQRAIGNGMTLNGALALAREVRGRSPVPLVVRGYYNPLLRFGMDRFLGEMAGAGVDGLIVPDMPFEESGEMREAARKHAIGLTFLVAPTTPEDRLSVIDAVTSDFLYCVSLTGVTGARKDLDPGLPAYLARVAAHTAKPFVVGFGISEPEQVDRVVPPAAGVVIGSALVKAIGAVSTETGRIEAVRDFVTGFTRRERGTGA
jgi:tryptophan synthase alpha chain